MKTKRQLLTLSLISLLAAFSIVSAGQESTAAIDTRLEFRLASDQQRPGWEPAINGDATIYLAPDAALDHTDLAKAWYEPQGQFHNISVHFTEEATLEFARLTSKNVGLKIAIVFNGEVISAPAIRAPITQGRAMITGNFTEQEARDLAKRIQTSINEQQGSR